MKSRTRQTLEAMGFPQPADFGVEDQPDQLDYMVYLSLPFRLYTPAFSRALNNAQLRIIFRDLGIRPSDLDGDVDYDPGISGESSGAMITFPTKGPAGRLEFSLQGEQYQALPELSKAALAQLNQLEQRQGGN